MAIVHDTSKLKKGSVYLISDSHAGPFVFKAMFRKVTFDDFNKDSGYVNWLEDDGSGVGYHFIRADYIREGSLQGSEIVGIFVPQAIHLKDVAEDLRRRFGEGAMLIREEIITS